MPFTVVKSYYRQKNFDFFKDFANPFYSITFDLDITHVKAFADDHGYPVYFTLCYLFTRAAQPLEDFRYRLKDDQIILYDHLDLSAIVPAPGGLFSFAYMDYDPDPEIFMKRARQAAQVAGQYVTLDEPEETNHLLFTSLQGVPFTGMTHASTSDFSDARPNIAFGKFRRDGNRLLVPVGLAVNHLFIDGAPLGKLFENVQATYDNP